MISSIQHNMLMMNAGRHLNINTQKKAKTAEKLSSGYRINRAADDAAGLSISEKMRHMIRGLRQGTENAMDGISWVQIGDGSLEEAHDMLHRMTELAIKASNGTCTDTDRAMMEAEFEQLQTEIDRLTDNTFFNEKHIFKDHEYPYYQIEGATIWSPNRLHKVRDGENDLVITYRKQEDDPPTTVTITVDAGEYTTQELIDEIDTALDEAGLLKEGLLFEYTKEGTCNLNLEGGEKIDEVSGGLSYLLYDNFGGGDLGALIGTTTYSTDNSSIKIVAGVNDYISFKLIDPEDIKEENGPATVVGFTVDPGSKTKTQLMDMLKRKLIEFGVNPDADGDLVADEEVVKVEHYGTHIMMSSEQYILSEFQGNMFKVDDVGTYTSIFYDNIHEVQQVRYMPAVFQGAGVLQVAKTNVNYSAFTTPYDEEASVFHITKGVNNLLVLKPNETGQEITLDLTDLHGQTLDGKTMAEACSILNSEMEQRYGGAANVPLKFYSVDPSGYASSTNPNGYTWKTDAQGNGKYVGYTSMQIVSTTAEPGKRVGIDRAKSTAYNTLFATQGVTTYNNNAKFGGNDSIFDSNAKLTGGRNLTNGLKVTDDNNAFQITIGRVNETPLTAQITLDNSPADGKYTLAELVGQIQKKLDAAFANDPAAADMKDDQGRVIVVSSDGSGHIVLTGATEKAASIRVSRVTDPVTAVENKGYDDIFPDEKLTQKRSTPTTATTTATLVQPENGVTYEKNAAGDIIVKIPSAHDGDFAVWLDSGTKRGLTGADNLYNAAPNHDGIWKLEDLKAYINEKLAPVRTPIPFSSTFRETGTQDVITVPTGNISDTGHTYTSVPNNYSKSGKSTWSGVQGEGGELLTTTSPLVTTASIFTSDRTSFTFTSQKFRLEKSDGSVSEFTVDLNKTYTSAQLNTLKNDLQAAINAKNGPSTKIGGIIVGVSGSGLTFSVNMGAVSDPDVLIGDETTLTLDTSSQFLKDLHASKDSAEITIGASEKKSSYSSSSTKGVNDSFKITGGNQTLKFSITKPGSSTATSVEVTLNNGTTYNRDSLKTAINNKLKPQGYVADYDSYGRIVITADTAHAGDGHGITFDAAGSSGALKHIFGYDGSLTKGYKASGNLPLQMQKTVTIEKGKQNFKITVDGKDYTVTLAEGKYGEGGTKTLQQLADQIATQTGNKIKATVNANRYINLETVSSAYWNGSSGSMIEVAYDASTASAMPAIFGYTQTAGAEVEFVRSGGTEDAPEYTVQIKRKVLDGIPDNSYYKRVWVISDEVDAKGHSTSYQGGSFIYSDAKDYDPEYDDGHHSTQYSFMQGVSLAQNNKLDGNGKIAISEYNNDLKFSFTESLGTSSVSIQTISVKVPDGLYTPEELRDKLQGLIDHETGDQRKINVKLQEGGIRLEASNAGRRYRIYTKDDATTYRPSGDFYDKVLCAGGTTLVGTDNIQDKAGYAAGGEVYAVGRQDVKNNEVKIQKDGNDYLTLEFTYPPYDNAPESVRKTVRLEMTLDPGYYQGQALVDQIQEKLDAALEDAGLPKGLIEAGINTIKHDVYISGAINDRALAFKLSETVKGPAQGAYGIGAIGGTAAFSVFYATEGDIARAYIRGGKDISGGVEIKEGEEEFSVDVDGETYTITLEAGTYTADELAEHMNSVMHDDPDNKVPLIAVIDEGRLKLMHNRYGKHKISNLQGSIKERMFFAERGVKTTEDPIRLRMSSTSGDWINIERPWMNTMSLGVNSLTVSQIKYAQKAITRLKEAVIKVSEVRTYFGTMQNRLEHAIHNNQNAEENTQAAESRIRDADISKEIMENSIHNILEQAGVSMMAQIRQDSNMALQLLQ